jgi:CxxC-x17-CxxC domain-containing protein
MAAMARVDMPEEERKDFYLYVDEFQNFATESFANILSEARKYRLNLILANQYVTQIDEIVRDAIFGNAGTLIAFRVGAVDSEFLEKEFEPVFMMNDVVNLAKYNIYLKLMIDGIAGDAFSATTLPPIETQNMPDVSLAVITASRERYASPKEVVEENIREWSGVFAPAVSDSRPVQNQQPTTNNQQHQTRNTQPTTDDRRPTTRDAKFATQNLQPTTRGAQHETRNSKPTTQSAEPVQPTTRDAKFETRSVKPTTDDRRSTTRDAEVETQDVKLVTSVGKQGEDRVWYDAQCETCGLNIQLPFVPDGRRPTFCKECLKEYQRTTAKAKEQPGLTVPSSQSGQNSPLRNSAGPGKPMRKRVAPDTDAIRDLLQKARGSAEE